MPGKAYSTIQEVSAQYGVSFRTLRFYEDLELLSPYRTGNSRYYTDQDKSRLELIIKAKKLGFDLREIWRLIHDAPKTLPDLKEIMSKDEIFQRLETLERRREDIKDAIAELKAALAARSS